MIEYLIVPSFIIGILNVLYCLECEKILVVNVILAIIGFYGTAFTLCVIFPLGFVSLFFLVCMNTLTSYFHKIVVSKSNYLFRRVL